MAENSSMGGPMEKQPQEPEEHLPPQSESYWGSVRFFKHLILAVLALAILILWPKVSKKIPASLIAVVAMSAADKGRAEAAAADRQYPARPRPACGERFPGCGRQLPGPGEGTAA